MLTPREFREEYPPEQLDQELPDRPITSLRDVQYLYGTLYTLATAGGGPYAAYLTPNQADDLIDEPESLIAVRVDLSGDRPRLDPDTPVEVTTYKESLVGAIAHCKYASARGIDHSVTHRSGRDSAVEKLSRYAYERLSKWATDDVVHSVSDDHEDGWIIDSLATLGQDDDVRDRVESTLEARLGGSRTALLTVRVKLDPVGEYRWPGDIEVFNAAMRARKLSKLVSKNDATDSAGTATDLVSGEVTRTVGTAEDPLNYFLGKQTEKFPNFDPDEAWRAHPISEDGAVTVMNAESFVEACTYRTFGATVYYLPYFLGRTTSDQAYTLYSILRAATRDDGDDRETPVERTYNQLDDPFEEETRLRFYVAAVMKHQSKRYDVFGDTMNGRLLYPSELTRAHDEILDSWVFNRPERQSDRTAALPIHENWPLLSNVTLRTIASGSYFYGTFPMGDTDTDAAADDLRIQALVAALSGEPLPVETLLTAYVDRLLDDDGEDFPRFVVASQFAQLCALARAGLLTIGRGTQTDAPLTDSPTYDTTEMTPPRAKTDGGTVTPADKLASFIDQTPALQHSERRAAYLLGALVGAVGSYQQWAEGRSTTLIDQYPVKSISRNRIKKVTEESIGKLLTYTRQDNGSVTKYEWIVNPLRETILEQDPDDWRIGTDDLRFYYALGVTYGMNDRPQTTDDNETEA